MADDISQQHADDLGELRGQVRGLQSGFADLGRKVDEGLRNLTEYIRSSTEKTEQRIDAAQVRNDAKFEALANQQLAAVAGRGTNTWPIIGLVVTALIGVASLAFTFWSLAKAPVDDKFSAMAAAITANAADLREYIKDQRQADKNFVPTAEIRIIEDNQRQVSDRQFNIAIAAAKAEQKIMDNVETIGFIREDLKQLTSTSPSKDEFKSQNERITTLSARIQTLYDKNYATPKFPCLDSGAGCGPVGVTGPQAQPSQATGGAVGK